MFFHFFEILNLVVFSSVSVFLIQQRNHDVFQSFRLALICLITKVKIFLGSNASQLEKIYATHPPGT